MRDKEIIEPESCPNCQYDYRPVRGTSKDVIGIYILPKNIISAFKCPHCGHEWPRFGREAESNSLERAKDFASDFLKYGEHLSWCRYSSGGDRCNCGFYQARQNAREIFGLNENKGI